MNDQNNEDRVKKLFGNELFGWLNRFGPFKRLSRYRKFLEKETEGHPAGRATDSEENYDGVLVDDEGVQIPAVWVVELYTPSTINGLLKGISDLGWDQGLSRNDSLLKWMSDVRQGRYAGWINLGLVSSPNSKNFMRERVADLPYGVTAAMPVLMSLTPSLTAFVVLFIFEDSTADSLVSILREKFTTLIRRDSLLRPWHVVRHILFNSHIRLGHAIYSPDLIRREKIQVHLKQLENGCIKWVHAHIPGAFASLPDIPTPTATLLVTEKVRPLSDEARRIRAFEGLGINQYHGIWESSKWVGARLVMPIRGWEEKENRLVFACRRFDAFPEEPGYHNPSSNWTISQRADDYVQRLLARQAITCLLDGYHQTLSSLRDKSAQDGKYRPVRDLKELRALVRTKLYDINTCTQEIVEFVKSDFDYCDDVMNMTYISHKGNGKIDLLSNMRSHQTQRALQVKRDADLLLSTLSTSSNISQTISNIRLQQFVAVLTILSVVIAVIALRVSSPSPPEADIRTCQKFSSGITFPVELSKDVCQGSRWSK
jgi:hypothetical protein